MLRSGAELDEPLFENWREAFGDLRRRAMDRLIHTGASSSTTQQTARAYAHLGDAVVRSARWRMLAYTEAAIARVAQLKALRLNVRLTDLRIASIALENGAVVVTRNRRDFRRVPGLSLDDRFV
jgi:predicted nucleic acid-binding protein